VGRWLFSLALLSARLRTRRTIVPVAVGGTAPTTPRRPADPEDAWRLAGQFKAVGGSLQMYQYELAFALMQADAWVLHDRP
jgi:hypothetical protein